MWGIIDSSILFLRPLCLAISQDGERDVLEWCDSNVDYRFKSQMQTGCESADSGKWRPLTWGDVLVPPLPLNTSIHSGRECIQHGTEHKQHETESNKLCWESWEPCSCPPWVMNISMNLDNLHEFLFPYMCFCFFFLYIEKSGPELVIINCF